MISRKLRASLVLLLASGICCSLLGGAWLASADRAEPDGLPPRPDPPTPTPALPPRPPWNPSPTSRGKPESEGAHIELHLWLSPASVGSAGRRDLWTVVQWQDAQGGWHDVEGWRGALDGCDAIEGQKKWWLAQNLFGKGPFRWQVWRGEGGDLLTTSAPFYLPTAGETARVEVWVAPPPQAEPDAPSARSAGPTPRPGSPPQAGAPAPASFSHLLPAEPGVEVEGAHIELRVRLSPAAQKTVRWQDLWTVMQWQDGLARWRYCQGWRGALDTFADGEGRKAWWVAERDLGTGPFRWLVYRGEGGELLAISKPFHLPRGEGETLWVEVPVGALP